MPKCSNHKCKICSKYGLLDHKISLLTLCLLPLSVCHCSGLLLCVCCSAWPAFGKTSLTWTRRAHSSQTPTSFQTIRPRFPTSWNLPPRSLGTPESIRQCSQRLSYPGHLNLCETEFSRKQYGGPLLLNFRVELIWRSYKAMQTIYQTVNWYINFTIQTLARVLEGANS